jgi:topoisomerase IV subunit B
MGDSPRLWRATTHDWGSTVDAGHLAEVRRDPAGFAPNGVVHLVLEVLAYAADEAEGATAGRAVVTLVVDGSISVSDDGRGTDTRRDDRGRPVRKPVIATKDLRFFDVPDAEVLPDGHPRRGMSVVAALSVWVIHVNRRRDGAWTQRYRHGVPVTGLVPIDADGTTGTTVHFLPDAALCGTATVTAAEVRSLAVWPQLSVEVVDKRDS